MITGSLPNVFLIQLDTQSKMNSGAFEHRLFAASKRFVLPNCPRVSPEMYTHRLLRDNKGRYTWEIFLDNTEAAEQDATTSESFEQDVRIEVERLLEGIGYIRSFSAYTNLPIPTPFVDIPVVAEDGSDFESFGTADAPWSDYATDSGTTNAGKELPASILGRITEFRNAVPNEPNLKPYGKGHVYFALEDKAHRAWIAEWLAAKMAVANEADRRKIRAFEEFQKREGTTASINTYDSQIVTWGTGWGGLGWMGVVMTRATANKLVRSKLEQAGVRYRSRNTYDIVDLATKRVITGKQEALEVMRGSVQILNLLIQLSRSPETREAVADAQLSTFFISAGDISNAAEMSTQALFNMVSHLKHWAPGYATGCLEWAVPQVAGQTISPERDKNLAPIIGRYFYGKARGKSWIPDWKQFQSYWQHMKEDGLDCLSDPFIKAPSYPTTDPFTTVSSKPAPAATPTQPTSSSAARTPILRSALLSHIEQLETVAQGKSLLRRGAQGPGVRALQQVLLNAGFQLPTGTNGIFDEFMEAAVQAFQRSHGIVADGVIGAMTMKKLDDAATS